MADNFKFIHFDFRPSKTARAYKKIGERNQ